MATLTNETVASTYPLLLKVETTGVHATTMRTVEDGDATSSALQISGAAVSSTGTLTSTGDFDVNTDKFTVAAATGNSVIAGTLGVTGVITATGGVAGAVTGNVTGDITGAVTATGTLANGVTASTQTINDNSTKVATTAYVDAAVPSGCIMQYAAVAAPTGWLLCDGDATLNTYTYRILHAIISNTYGGDVYDAGTSDQSGATTVFTLPNFKGRVPIGVGQQSNVKWNSSAEDYTTIGTDFALAGSGGTEDHSVTDAQMPSHTHTTHHEGDFAAGGYAQFGGGGSAYNSEVESSSAGSDAAHNNTQPYLVVNYIIKT